jgi:hypothetical protein
VSKFSGKKRCGRTVGLSPQRAEGVPSGRLTVPQHLLLFD